MGKGVGDHLRIRMKKLLAVALMALTSTMLFSLDGQAPGGQAPVAPSIPRTGDAARLRRVETDSRGDGFVDDVVYLNEKGQKVREEFDFNRDGKMDDFLWYENGLLAREEIDSRFSGKIDIRVYLFQGAYIERYERDTDGDGVPDMVKDYARKK